MTGHALALLPSMRGAYLVQGLVPNRCTETGAVEATAMLFDDERALLKDLIPRFFGNKVHFVNENENVSVL